MKDHLYDTLVTIDNDAVSLKESLYYIMLMEGEVNEKAIAYDSKNPRIYWNLYINNKYIRTWAKETVMSIIIRDYIYYHEALSENITLSDEDISQINDDIANILKNMTAAQMSSANYTENELFLILSKIAYAKKYIKSVSSKNSSYTEDSFNEDGEYYNSIYNSHSVKINDKLWENIKLGEITLNYSLQG